MRVLECLLGGLTAGKTAYGEIPKWSRELFAKQSGRKRRIGSNPILTVLRETRCQKVDARMHTMSPALSGSAPLSRLYYAFSAQLAEQLFCNQQVIGSSPIGGLFVPTFMVGY